VAGDTARQARLETEVKRPSLQTNYVPYSSFPAKQLDHLVPIVPSSCLKSTRLIVFCWRRNNRVPLPSVVHLLHHESIHPDTRYSIVDPQSFPRCRTDSPYRRNRLLDDCIVPAIKSPATLNRCTPLAWSAVGNILGAGPFRELRRPSSPKPAFTRTLSRSQRPKLFPERPRCLHGLLRRRRPKTSRSRGLSQACRCTGVVWPLATACRWITRTNTQMQNMSSVCSTKTKPLPIHLSSTTRPF